MKRILPAAISAFLLSSPAVAQEMYKCKNAAGRLTYASQPCKDLGLSPAGEVKGQISISPGLAPAPAAKPAEKAAEKAPGKAPEAKVEAKKEVKVESKPVATKPQAKVDTPQPPDPGCVMVRTVTGMARQCPGGAK